MVTSIARQAIIIKSKVETGILLTNYECAYCMGLLSKLAQILEDDNYDDMISWHKDVVAQLSDFTAEDKRVMRVLALLRAYEPQPDVDEQVKELYHMGLNENRIWEM